MTSIWNETGSDSNYEHARQANGLAELREWMDQQYYAEGLKDYLDDNFLSELRNNGFNARLWELALAAKLKVTGLRMIPTHGVGPDFCIELPGGGRAWIEAVHTGADDAQAQEWMDRLQAKGGEFDTQIDEVVLRFSSSLYGKAVKINQKYLSTVGADDFMLIGVASLDIHLMWTGLDTFMKAVYPIGAPVVHFTTDGSKLDPAVKRPTHAPQPTAVKKSGVEVKKEFLYPGDEFPFIDGVLYSEASDIQQLRGTSSTSFNETTAALHIFGSHSGKQLPGALTKLFYNHVLTEGDNMISVEMIEPQSP